MTQKFFVAGVVLFSITCLTFGFFYLPNTPKEMVLLNPSEPNDECKIKEKNKAKIEINGFERRPDGIQEIWGQIKNIDPEKVKIVILEYRPRIKTVKESIICQPNDDGRWQAFGFTLNTAELICLILPYHYEKKVSSGNLQAYLDASLAHIVFNRQRGNSYFANTS